jgi:hypothetical protein
MRIARQQACPAGSGDQGCQTYTRSPLGLPVPLRRATSRRDGQLELFGATRRPVRLVQANGWVRRWLRFGRHGVRWQQAPEKAARRAVFRLATEAMPKQLRDAINLLRGLRGLALRQR